jgi:hypothetical protein
MFGAPGFGFPGMPGMTPDLATAMAMGGMPGYAGYPMLPMSPAFSPMGHSALAGLPGMGADLAFMNPTLAGLSPYGFNPAFTGMNPYMGGVAYGVPILTNIEYGASSSPTATAAAEPEAQTTDAIVAAQE